MAAAGKSIRRRHGAGSHHVNRWTTLRAGALAAQRNTARDDMFVDISPYVSLAGIDTERELRRRASTHIDLHAIARTRGKNLRAPTMHRHREHLVTGHGNVKDSD